MYIRPILAAGPVTARVVVTRIVALSLAGCAMPAIAQTGYQQFDSARADLLDILDTYESIQQHSDSSQPGNSILLDRIRRDTEAAVVESDHELEALSQVGRTLQPLKQELRELDQSVASLSPAAPEEQTPTRLEASFDCDYFIEPAGELVDPPGPCDQSNYNPADSPRDFDSAALEPTSRPYPIPLTDLEYPDFVGCRAYRDATTVYRWRTAVAAAKVVQIVADRACKQIYTAAGVGGNASLLCIITDTAYLVVKQFSDNIANCQTFRIATEGTATYIRTGELFIQNVHNTELLTKRVQAGFEDSQSGMNDIKIQVEENSRSIEKLIEVLSELSKTMDIDDAPLLRDDPLYDGD